MSESHYYQLSVCRGKKARKASEVSVNRGGNIKKKDYK